MASSVSHEFLEGVEERIFGLFRKAAPGSLTEQILKRCMAVWLLLLHVPRSYRREEAVLCVESMFDEICCNTSMVRFVGTNRDDCVPNVYLSREVHNKGDGSQATTLEISKEYIRLVQEVFQCFDFDTPIGIYGLDFSFGNDKNGNPVKSFKVEDDDGTIKVVFLAPQPVTFNEIE